MSTQGDFEKAFFVIRDANAAAPKRNNISKANAIEVNFNPTSLQYVITNTPADPSRGNKKKQHVSQSTAKLTMDLIFDSTDKGADVRTQTQKIAKLMHPVNKSAPPLVLFAWGNFLFQGMVDGFKETLDFFSANGIPLRSSVNVTMSQQDTVFQEIDPKFGAITNQSLQAVDIPASQTENPTTTAARGGDPRAAREIAASNNLESTRFGSSDPMTVGTSIPLKPPVAFASGSSFGGGLSADAGLSLGGGAGAGGGLSLGGGIGGSASAGVSVSEGAFAGLRVSGGAQTSAALDPSRLIQRSESLGLSTDAGATFDVGGRATVEGSASLNADVGVNADLRSRIQFDE